MIGSIISGVAGLAQGVMGAVKARKARKREADRMNQEKAEMRQDFNRDYYQDLTQRADMQYLLNQQWEADREAIRRARATNVVAGGTTESEMASKNAAAKGMTNTLGRIASISQQAKQGAINNLNAMRRQQSQQQSQANNFAMQQGANAMGAGFGQMASAVGALGDTLFAKKDKPAQS